MYVYLYGVLRRQLALAQPLFLESLSEITNEFSLMSCRVQGVPHPMEHAFLFSRIVPVALGPTIPSGPS